MTDFWSKRRAAVAEEAQGEVQARQAALRAETEAAQAAKTDEELLQELGLPEPETLQADGDFKAFLGEAVPARLRARALRRLWRVNPTLANLDGLIDYGEDFTDAATVVENLQTAYQVGKGMLRHVEELARPATGETDVDAAPAERSVEAEPQDEDEQPMQAADVPVADDDRPTAAAAWPDEDELPPAPRNRRMNFTFDEQRSA